MKKRKYSIYRECQGRENLDKIPVAVIGATGAVGQRFVALLWGHPWFDLRVVVASGKSQGHIYRDIASWRLKEIMPEGIGEMNVEQIHPKTFKDKEIKLIFSALPPKIAKDVEMDLASLGFFVFSNASANRMADYVPLLIADINPDHLALVEHQKKTKSGYVVTNANCSVTGLATALKPLHEAFGIKSVVVTTYQALSGAGYPGVPSLDITGNIVPYIQSEEEKIEVECRKILGKLTDSGIEHSPINVYASCARVPVRDGHLESVLVDFKEDVSEEEVKRALSGYEGLDNKTPT